MVYRQSPENFRSRTIRMPIMLRFRIFNYVGVVATSFQTVSLSRLIRVYGRCYYCTANSFCSDARRVFYDYDLAFVAKKNQSLHAVWMTESEIRCVKNFAVPRAGNKFLSSRHIVRRPSHLAGSSRSK
jgi:hypothetical protein